MARMFGTDGVRGVAGSELTCEIALQIGRGAAAVLTKNNGGRRPLIFIGKDTRISGDMLESALAAGLCSVGADVELLGVLPTPGVAWLARKHGADAGIVISASHNPMEFNGIKIFQGNGYKLPDAVEDEIEAVIHGKSTAIATGADVGRVTLHPGAVDEYVEYLTAEIGKDTDLSGLNVLFDCANGASARVAQKLFPALGCRCTFIGADPNGTNINAGCGSTHLDKLEEQVRAGGYDCGVAFDGDADRCLACDENGREIDGDKIIALLACDMKQKGQLNGNTAVVTVMSNLGFMNYMKSQGVNAVRTSVGDRYVLEEMLAKGYVIGGEQSGHVILLNHSTTGDGELTGGKLLALLAEKKCKMSLLNGCYDQYPQVLVNVTADTAQKAAFKADAELAAYIQEEEKAMNGEGRVLVRLSGTEPKIRVMVEGKDTDAINAAAERIVKKISERILGR